MQQGPYPQYPTGMVYAQPNQAYPAPVMIPNYPPQTTHQSIQINPYTFMNEVRLVTLDSNNRYLGQEVCLYCSQRFTQEVETRILPCQHAFHGKCAYDAIAIGNNKYCPMCKTQYS